MAPPPPQPQEIMMTQHPNPYFYAQLPQAGSSDFNFSAPSYYGSDHHTFLSPTPSNTSSSSAPQQQQQQPEVARFPAWFGSSFSTTPGSSDQSGRGYDSRKRE
ncbi:hypothetical protein HS088_TW19G00607 [Tripterygium wilfordii]|uniref:Uncharacterized protein n=2 Tax=Tripterygium wilfordii TaxID=458696 RepID=A0A7J7CA11_TRIWF|nr:hypothetical protein HS088_TW19G00607 [Tripterygium wilfordii]